VTVPTVCIAKQQLNWKSQ